MKIVTFNVNSIRIRLDHLAYITNKYNPDIIGLQEIKVESHIFPISKSESWDYEFYVHGQKSYHGVAVMSKHIADSYDLGISFEKEQARFIYCKFMINNSLLHFINCYFPQGDNRNEPIKFPYKLNFYQTLFTYINEHFTPNDNLLIVGDFNIAPKDIDIGIGEKNKLNWLRIGKCSFLPEERDELNNLLNWGLYDGFRHIFPDNAGLTWFDYRSRGFDDDPKRGLRIDYGLMTKPLLDRLNDVIIDYDVRAMKRPSDHCPVIFQFD